MNLMTDPRAIWLRNLLRASGIARPINKLLIGRSGYEKKVDAALLAMIRPGDVIWDVGANVGYYTTKMSEQVGPEGHVYAFEPSPDNFARLKDASTGHSNVTLLPLGLSSTAGALRFLQGEDSLGATSRLAQGSDLASDQLIDVEVSRADDLVAQGRAAPPNAIKIDVEGHELEVLKGFGDLLKHPGLRQFIIEVHFGLLAQANAADAPGEIAASLEAAGFAIEWIDLSHMRATRQAA